MTGFFARVSSWPRHRDTGGDRRAGGARGSVSAACGWRTVHRLLPQVHRDLPGMELLDSKLGGTIPPDIILEPLDMDEPLPGLEPVAGTRAAPVAEDDLRRGQQDFACRRRRGRGGDGWEDEWEDEFASDVDDFETAGESLPQLLVQPAGYARAGRGTPFCRCAAGDRQGAVPVDGFRGGENLLGEDVGSVELALVQKSLPPDVSAMMVDPYFSRERSRRGSRCGSWKPARICADQFFGTCAAP